MNLVDFNKLELKVIRRLLERQAAIADVKQYDKQDRDYKKLIDGAIYKIDLFLDADAGPSKDEVYINEEEVEVVNMKADRNAIEDIARDLKRVRNTIDVKKAGASFDDPLFNLMVSVEAIHHLLTNRLNRKLRKYGYEGARYARGLSDKD